MIKIEQLLPFMKDGWVAMDWNGDWHWFIRKPYIPAKEGTVCWAMRKTSPYNVASLNRCLDIAPADDWEKSLIRVKGEKE